MAVGKPKMARAIGPKIDKTMMKMKLVEDNYAEGWQRETTWDGVRSKKRPHLLDDGEPEDGNQPVFTMRAHRSSFIHEER